MFPGTYAIRYSGERVADLFKRAGGCGWEHILKDPVIQEVQQCGTVPIDFKKALEDESSRDNVILYDRDSIHVAIVEDVVYVTGEVIVPSPSSTRRSESRLLS